jgi:hypothetical protein
MSATMAMLAYKWVASIAMMLSLALIAGIWHMGGNSMIACGFLGAFFIFAGMRPGTKQLLCQRRCKNPHSAERKIPHP